MFISATRMALAVVILLSLAWSMPARSQALEDFRTLLDDHWEWRLQSDPEFASRIGDRRYKDQWLDRSPDAWNKRHAARQAFLRRLRHIDVTELPEAERLNYDLLGQSLQDSIDAHRFNAHLMPINPRGGVQNLDSAAEWLRLDSTEDYEGWLARMDGIESVLEQTMELQEAGRKGGYMPPRILMERIPAQLEVQLVELGSDSPYFRAFEDMPNSISEADQEKLRERAITIIEKSIVPAYRDFTRYFVRTYVPASRDSIGASALPDGEAFYEYRTRSYTTTSMTPDEIHRLGLEEVARIRGEMQTIIDELAFEGGFDEFLEFLRTDPQFYFDSPQALFEAYLAICKRIDPELVRLFGRLPRMPYGLRQIPESIAPDTTTAYYQRPAADGSRPGYYYVNLYRPEVRPTYEMEVLSVHEAVPGHHLQIALQMELPDVPAFRRYSGFTAFTEGWGLYSESLGYDLGLYRDPYSRFGALTYEMWRAVRLVVDTGIHYKGWTRDQAIGFFRDNAAKTEADIVNEIDRYIGWPGQALAYKIGQLKILEIRRHAEQTLGERFDIRAFHDALLGGGALPLNVLETRMNRWLSETLASR